MPSRCTEEHIRCLVEKGWIRKASEARVTSLEESTPQPCEDEVIFFLKFFYAGLWFPWISMLAGVLSWYEL